MLNIFNSTLGIKKFTKTHEHSTHIVHTISKDTESEEIQKMTNNRHISIQITCIFIEIYRCSRRSY